MVDIDDVAARLEIGRIGDGHAIENRREFERKPSQHIFDLGVRAAAPPCFQIGGAIGCDTLRESFRYVRIGCGDQIPVAGSASDREEARSVR